MAEAEPQEGTVASKPFRSGLVSVTFRQLPAEEIARVVEEAGLEGIEWGGDVHAPAGDLKAATRLRGLMDAAGLVASAYGSYYKFGDIEAFRAEGPEFEAALDTATALGAPVIRVWAGQEPSARVSDSRRAALVERSREIAEAAAHRGLGVAFEFHDNTLADTPETVVELLEAIGSDNVSTFWQTPLGMPPTQRLAGLRRLSKYVSNIHCNWFGQNLWPGIQDLEMGAAEWAVYLDQLSTLGTERWISIEFVKGGALDQFRKDAATLRRWLADASRR